MRTGAFTCVIQLSIFNSLYKLISWKIPVIHHLQDWVMVILVGCPLISIFFWGEGGILLFFSCVFLLQNATCTNVLPSPCFWGSEWLMPAAQLLLQFIQLKSSSAWNSITPENKVKMNSWMRDLYLTFPDIFLVAFTSLVSFLQESWAEWSFPHWLTEKERHGGRCLNIAAAARREKAEMTHKRHKNPPGFVRCRQ